jgi:hypothetical protein
MTDRPNPEQVRPEGPASEHEAQESAAPETASPEQPPAVSGSPSTPDSVESPWPEPPPLSVPIEPIPLEPTPPLPTETAEPAPEPESSQPREEVEAEPHTSVEAVAEPAAPPQVAPEPGRPPIPMEPEPSVQDAVSPEPAAPVALAVETDETLALPPTTKEVEPAPAPSAPPPPPTGVPVPFASPPTGHSRRFGLKLGLGITAGALGIIGVVMAVVIAMIVFTNSITEKVESTAEEFIGAIAEDDWDTAYAMLCDAYRQHPADDYVPEWDAWDTEGAEIQHMNASTGNVTVEFDDGTAVELVIAIEQTPEALNTSVCGWRDVTA